MITMAGFDDHFHRNAQAGWALAATNDAGDLPEDMAEAATEGGALVFGQAEAVLCFKRDFEAGHPERI